jgi:hypothetical protein
MFIDEEDRLILRFAVEPSGNQVLSLGPLAVEIEIGREGKGHSKGGAGI